MFKRVKVSATIAAFEGLLSYLDDLVGEDRVRALLQIAYVKRMPADALDGEKKQEATGAEQDRDEYPESPPPCQDPIISKQNTLAYLRAMAKAYTNTANSLAKEINTGVN